MAFPEGLRVSLSSLSIRLSEGDAVWLSSFGTLRAYELATSTLPLSFLLAGLSCGDDDGGEAVLLLNFPEDPCSGMTDSCEASLWLSVIRVTVDF